MTSVDLDEKLQVPARQSQGKLSYEEVSRTNEEVEVDSHNTSQQSQTSDQLRREIKNRNHKSVRKPTLLVDTSDGSECSDDKNVYDPSVRHAGYTPYSIKHAPKSFHK